MKISIIIPVYNVERFLRECLDSVVAQTFGDLEIVCVDDGSPDRCGEILDEYAANDSRFKIVKQKNAGLSAARNAGLAVATGEYVFFLDSDDFVAPTLCEKALAVALETGADATVFGGWDVDATGRNVVKTRRPNEALRGKTLVDPLEKLAFNFNFWGPTVWKFLWRRDFLNENSLRFLPGVVCEDAPFTAAAATLANGVAVCAETLIYYRLRDDSLMRNCESNVYRGGGVVAYDAALEAVERIFAARKESDSDVAQRLRTLILRRKIAFLANADGLPFSKETRAAFENGIRDGLVDGEICEATRRRAATAESVGGGRRERRRERRTRRKARALYRSLFAENRAVRFYFSLERRVRRAIKRNRFSRFFEKIRRAAKRLANGRKS